jgi:hypothetical protein
MSLQYNNYTNKLRFTAGPAAAHVYDDSTNSKISIDWSFDGLYYQYNNGPWITLSLGPKTTTNELDKINTPEMKSVFKSLCFYGIENLQGYSGNSDKALPKVYNLTELFV